MARKSKRVIEPELPQAELEDELTKHTRTVGVAEPSKKGRIRGATAVPQGDAPSRDAADVINMTLQVNAGAIGWSTHNESALEATAGNWAAILLRDIRYGIPYDELQGEGFHIREDDSLGEPPVCDNCKAEEEAA
jgi:hypothetical protein